MTHPHSDRIDHLITRRRPNPSNGVDSLMAGASYDQPLSAIAAFAATGRDADDYQQRIQDLADQAYHWGSAALTAHTGEAPSTAAAVYYGGIRLGAYLATYAIAAYCQTHPETRGDDQLQEIVAEFTRTLGAPSTSRDKAMRLGMRLHRHTTTFGYATRTDLQVLRDLARIGMASNAAERNAARGKTTRTAFNLISGNDNAKTAIQTAPLPTVATAR